MAKVSIGLRGWRFEESEVFTDDGDFKPLDEIPEEPRERLLRLSYIVTEPCDACYLVHGEADKRRCNEATIVYGEPLDEVLLCDRHEADFLYWYREAGGSAHRGDPELRDEFHEWFADGGRAPEGYGGVEHVDTDPEDLPDPPDAQEVQRRLEEMESFEGARLDMRELLAEEAREADEEDDEERLDPDDDLELDMSDYPRR
jgi:hypothetical protein